MVNYNCGIKSKGTITIIQGDTFQRTFVIRMTGGDKLLPKEQGNGGVIEELYFTCAKLGIDHYKIPVKLDSNNKEMRGYYKLTFDSDYTNTFPKCNTTYDITLNFGRVGSSDVIKTIRYEYPLEVLPKINRVDYNK